MPNKSKTVEVWYRRAFRFKGKAVGYVTALENTHFSLNKKDYPWASAIEMFEVEADYNENLALVQERISKRRAKVNK